MQKSSLRRPSASGLACIVAFVCVALAGCSRFGAVYPPRPPAIPGSPPADPVPSRLVVHLSVTHDGLVKALDGAVPRSGDGEIPILGSVRHYDWTRTLPELHFTQGRVALTLHVDARVALPLHTVDLPIDLDVLAEPVMNRDYAVKLQSVDVKVSSKDRRLEVANVVGGVFDAMAVKVKGELESFSYDVKPLLGEAYSRVAHPLRFPVGDAKGCARVSVLAVEAGPTVIADGLEKDVAFVVSPSVTFPCGPEEPAPPLPVLENVASLPTGPFTLSVPVAASYDELAHAMSALFTGGKLAFSKEFPGLVLERPEIYESQGLVVLKLHLAGPVHAMGIDTDLDGDIFFSGHVALVDNELAVPDLEPTIETQSFLLSLKAATGSAAIRDQARSALRLDLSQRLKDVKKGLEGDLTFGGPDACFRANLDKLELTSVFAHGTYLRVYVTAIGRAGASLPCATP